MSLVERGDLLYLNNAGAGIQSRATMAVQIDHLTRESQIGAYPAAAEAADSAKQFYARCAELIGVSDQTQIAFMDSASRAWDMALYGSGVQAGQSIVTLSSEFGTNLVSIYHFAAKVGAEVVVVECDRDGSFSLDNMQRAIEGASLLAVSHVAAHASIVNPVETLGELARLHGVTYLLDGCQALGQFRVDVESIGCDAYTATGRKWLCGPRGTGFLYVRHGDKFRTPYVDLANASLKNDSDGRVYAQVNPTAKQFELWERNVAGMLGLSNAIHETLALLNDDSVMTSWAAKANRVRATVARNSNLTLLGSETGDSKTTGFLADGGLVDAAKVAFQEAGLTVSFMGPWDAPLHVPQGYSSVVRLAPHSYTPDRAIEMAEQILSCL